MPKKRRISDGKRGSRGQESRERIISEAVQMASREGLQALTIGRMAAELGMSKSGLFAHFGSKQKLQLATIERANGIFDEAVLTRSLEKSPEGIIRLWTLCDLWIRYLVTGVFPSGYFFTGAFMEYGQRRGSVAASLRAVVKTWLTALHSSAQHAQGHGELKPEPSAEDMAFEINALLVRA